MLKRLSKIFAACAHALERHWQEAFPEGERIVIATCCGIVIVPAGDIAVASVRAKRP